jgi:hypothetical protein
MKPLADASDMTAVVETEDCAEDFTDKMFWMAMREESFWMNNQQYADFYMFWEEFHMDNDDDDHHHDDYDRECEDVQIDVDCSAFSFTEGDDCMIKAEYNRCPEREHFICDIVSFDAYGAEEFDNCAEDFEDAAFWGMMREEQFWSDNMDKYWDFYGFWEEYHTTGRDDDNHDDYGNSQCMDYDCRADTSLDHCEMKQCYDMTTQMDWCEAEWQHHGESYEGSCDDLWQFFDGPTDPTDGDCEWECEMYYDCSDDMNMDKCEVSTCYEPCDMEGACFVDFFGADGEERMDCEEFMNMFDIDMEDDDCSICEKVDCTAESFMAECEMNVCFDHCTFEEKCYVHFQAVAGDDMHRMNCETFSAMMSGECVDVEEHGSCMNEMTPFVDDVVSCDFHVKFNTCVDDEHECSAVIVIGDERYDFDDCDDAEEHFDLPECDWRFMEGDCMEMVEVYIPGLEQCNFQTMVDTCTGEEKECFAELLVDGQPISGDCDELEVMFDMPDDEECPDHEPRKEGGSCLEDILQYVDDVTACDFEIDMDYCSMEELSCFARVVVMD